MNRHFRLQAIAQDYEAIKAQLIARQDTCTITVHPRLYSAILVSLACLWPETHGYAEVWGMNDVQTAILNER